MPEVVRFYGHWKKYSFVCFEALQVSLTSLDSSKLTDENKRIRELRASHKGEDDEDLTTSQSAAPLSDDEGSVVREPPRGQNGCGACRTRESEMWWRAPKGLATEILCDNCGANWRKYADLSVRPVREDALSTGRKGVEKREGTPLNGPNAKRLKVWFLLRSLCAAHNLHRCWLPMAPHPRPMQPRHSN